MDNIHHANDKDDDLSKAADDTNSPTTAADSSQLTVGVAIGNTENGDYFQKKIHFWKTNEYINDDLQTDVSTISTDEPLSSLLEKDVHSDNSDYDMQIFNEFSRDLDKKLFGKVDG